MEHLYWRFDPSRSRLLDFTDTLLRTMGSIFFCTNALSGILFLAGLLLLVPKVGIFGILGGIAAQLFAMALRRDRAYMKIGFYGFNGMLVGMYWCFLSSSSWLYLPAMVACSVATVPIMMLLNRYLVLSRFNLPPVSTASVLVTLPAMWLLRELRIAFPPTMVKPPGFDAMLSGDYLIAGQDVFTRIATMRLPVLAGIVLLLAGVLVHSRHSFFAALRGLFLGLGLAYLMGGRAGLTWMNMYVVTTIPISIAMDGFFFVPTRTARWYSMGAVLAGGGAWIVAVHLFDLLRLPELTVPFMTVTLAALTLAHLKPMQRLLPGLIPVPLIYADSPVSARRWHDDLETAHRYWRIVAPPVQEHNWRGDMASKIDRAVDMLLRSKNIVAFTGAGVSTESGIPDFRTGQIHWKKYDTSHFRFERFTTSEESRARYWEMSQDFFLFIKQARPNRTHTALTELEKMGKLGGIITQNVDRLHQKAGVSAEKVVEVHGNELFVSCLNCGKRYTREEIYDWILNGVKVPYCVECQGILKPDSVAFGQPMPLELSRRALDMVMRCDLMLVMGTSLVVQPAALLPWKAKQNGAGLIIVNLSSTVYDEHADVLIRALTGKVMGQIMDRIEQVKYYIQLP
ncbi:urea transporter [bacterium]|nr:urea transporter [candidate division CSSED10-310 bacterium]